MKAKDEIKILLNQNNKNEQWLADKLHFSYHRVYYLINNAKDIPLELYIQIMKIFQNMNEPSSIGGEKECEKVIDLTLRSNITIGDQLNKLNADIMELTADKELSIEDKMKINLRIDTMSQKVISTLQNLRNRVNQC